MVQKHDAPIEHDRMIMTNYIYNIRLLGGKYYIGKSLQPFLEFQKHRFGLGPYWTQVYKPLHFERITMTSSTHEEQMFVQKYVKEHGYSKVYVAADLYKQYQSRKTMEIYTDSSSSSSTSPKTSCTRCGLEGHTTKTCTSVYDVHGFAIEEISYDPMVEKKGVCYVCGQKGHVSDTCTAKVYVDGFELI
jgi:predicted GIY-YIG superfamily endonuclease